MSTPTDPYGHFSEDGTAYILTKRDTPKTWYNVHFSDHEHSTWYTLTSHLGNGHAFAISGDGQKCLYCPDKHRTVFLRFTDSDEIWSAPGYPVKTAIEDYRCVYTLYDTTIASVYRGIAVTQRTFVPQGSMHEIWTLTFENRSETDVALEVMPYAPVSFDKHPACSVRHQSSRFVPGISGMWASSESPHKPSKLFNAFLISSAEVVASRGTTRSFSYGIHSITDPAIPATFDPPHIGGCVDRMCCFLVNRITVPAGGKVRIDLSFGTAESIDSVKPITATIADPGAVDALHEAMAEEYRALCATSRIRTGEAATDAIMSFWIKKQMRSYLAFKNAYRDNLQIDMAYSAVDPHRCVANALDLLSFQYRDGRVPHSARPLNPLRYSDKPTWLLQTFPALVKETGDLSILDTPVPWLEEDGTHSSDTVTAWEHLVHTMRFLAADVGAHGINRMHHADWNDGLEGLRGGESTLTALLFAAGLVDFAKLADFKGDDAIAAEARETYATLKMRINKACWDGAWYNRGISAAGRVIGGKDCTEGSIFLNPQTWAVISGVIDANRIGPLLDLVDERLECEFGMNLCDPLFTRHDPDIGFMSANPPGIAENGVYLHASAFKLVADCIARRPASAWRLLHKLLPDDALNPLAQSGNLPFAVTNSWLRAPGSWGRCGSPWRTGTAGWIYHATMEYILGIRRGYDGLVVDPCLPEELKQVDVMRVFRGSRYEINLDNTAGRGVGVRELTVDGAKLTDTTLPLGAEHYHVRVII